MLVACLNSTFCLRWRLMDFSTTVNMTADFVTSPWAAQLSAMAVMAPKTANVPEDALFPKSNWNWTKVGRKYDFFLTSLSRRFSSSTFLHLPHAKSSRNASISKFFRKNTTPRQENKLNCQSFSKFTATENFYSVLEVWQKFAGIILMCENIVAVAQSFIWSILN